MENTELKYKLFWLIKKLTPSEKLWVIKCFKTFKQDNNLELFKFLDKQESYNSEELEKKLKKTTFYKYLSVQKHTLYNTILRFLRLYTEEEGSNYELWNALIDLTFLQERGLSSHCLEKLPKLKELADEQEQHYQFLKLLSIERDVFSAQQYQSSTLQELDTINQSYLQRLELLKEIWQDRHYASLISLLVRNTTVILATDRQQILEELKHYLSEKREPSNSAARYYYDQVNLLYHVYITGNFTQAFIHIEQQLEYLNTINIKTQSAEKNKVIIFINSIKVGFLAVVGVTKMEKLIENSRNLLQNLSSVELKYRLYTEFYYNKLNYYNYIGELNKVTILVKEILAAIKEDCIKTTPSLNLAIAVYYFWQSNYKEALTWNNYVLNVPSKNLSDSDLYSSILLELLLHIELKNIMYLSSLIQKFKYIINSKKGTSTELVNQVYYFFKSVESKMLSTSPNTSSLYQLFYTENSSKSLEFREIFQSLNLLHWLKLKLKN